MISVFEALSAPGSRKPITRAATTQLVEPATIQLSGNGLRLQPEAASNASVYNVIDEEKPRLLDRYLDLVVAASGSTFAFLATATLILLWAFMGIPYGQSEDWQVVISDVQAVFCYIFDSLLVRQQLNSYDRGVRISASFLSRAGSIRRMLRQVKNREIANGVPTRDIILDDNSTWLAKQSRESWVNKALSFVGHFFGHVVTMTIFWIGIFVWLSFGNYCGWSVKWQLYINSATSALMMLCFALIACTREQSRARTTAYLRHICHLDVAIEYQLRQMTGDTIPNEEITIYPHKVNRLQRAISYYADLVGTLVGIALLLSIMVIWISIGPSLHFNSNWWLIIGTYAGLIGMHDGFVLHNIQFQLNQHEESAMADVVREDSDNLAVVGLNKPSPGARNNAKASVTQWLSCRLSYICALEYSVCFGIITILGLLVAATALKWSVTGQLLCNVPPSIIETFIMMALITSHELDDMRQNECLGELAVAREMLTKWLCEAEVADLRAGEVGRSIDGAVPACLKPRIEEGGEK